ncbi:MAG: DUF58 domain-containing protein [Acidobacteria bacterium]|nr:DUF58 domain-containing protein [Acidobacteriota bacterium]
MQYRAQGVSLLPRRPLRSLLTGRHASRLRGRGLNFEEIRAYLPGDDIRTIDWRVTGRTQRPAVRVYTEERDRPLFVVVDQRISMFFGSRKNMNSVTAAEIAAAACWRALANGDRVGGVVFNDSESVEVKPLRSRSTVMRLLGEVVRMNRALNAQTGPKANAGKLNEVLDKLVRAVKHDSLVVVLSTFFGDSEETVRSLSRLAAHNDLVIGLIYDELQMHPPEGGRLLVTDGDLQIEVSRAGERERHKLSEFFIDRMQKTRQRLAGLGVPVMMISNAQDALEQVRRQIGGIAAAGRGGQL